MASSILSVQTTSYALALHTAQSLGQCITSRQGAHGQRSKFTSETSKRFSWRCYWTKSSSAVTPSACKTHPQKSTISSRSLG